MINTMRVSQTRDGYEVHSIRYYPHNEEDSRLLVDVEYDGVVETHPYYENGKYYAFNPSGMDLVVNRNKEPHQVVKNKEENL